MWDEITKSLAQFPDAVLTTVEADGYPLSIRCQPQADAATRVLRVPTAGGVDLRPGPASLLCHSHDENLWKLRAFLVRGRIETGDGSWVFHPQKFIPGGGMGGPLGDVRAIVGARRTAKRYLTQRGLARPAIPWDRIKAKRHQAAKPEPDQGARELFGLPALPHWPGSVTRQASL